MAPLARGAECVVPPLGELGLTGSSGFDPARFHAAVERFQPHSLILLPQMLRAWVGWLMQEGRAAPQGLRMVAVGGAAVGAPLLIAARRLGIPAYEGYGQSEGSSVQTLNLPALDANGRLIQPADDSAGSVGRLPVPVWLAQPLALRLLAAAGLAAARLAMALAPRSMGELRSAIKSWPGQIAVGGGRFSMGGQIAVRGGLHLDMRQLAGLVWLRPQERAVRVQAGMRWRDLQDLLDPHGLGWICPSACSRCTRWIARAGL